jgi:lysophospholipase L1-like esterase
LRSLSGNFWTSGLPLKTMALMRHRYFINLLLFGLCVSVLGRGLESKPADPFFEKLQPVAAPKPGRLILKKGDRLAICGDSITEQKMYSRIIEDYLTMCVPQLEVTVRQYGWSGERAPGFLARMTNDCLRFKPTIATTCYGMNDHEYRPYEDRIGTTYREKSTAIVEAFKAHGTRVVLGSPGCVGKMPGWVRSAQGTVEDLNLNLCNLRNMGIEIAQREKARFADVFWPMLTVGREGQRRFGTNFFIAGMDGVHPDWAGQAVMAYAFLRSFGLDGEIGKFTVDMKRNRMTASRGHEVLWAARGEFTVRSSRYPFCACITETGQEVAIKPSYPTCDGNAGTETASIRAALTLIPFDGELNRFTLVVRNGGAAGNRVTWGGESKFFPAEQLRRGINLAAEFRANPFSVAFAQVDAAVATRQAYETKQIKQIFNGSEGKADMEGAVAKTEREREPLAAAIHAAFLPVTHTIKIEVQ